MNAILASVVALFLFAMPLNDTNVSIEQNSSEDMEIIEDLETSPIENYSEELNIVENIETPIEEKMAEKITISEGFQTPLEASCDYYLTRGYVAYHKGIDLAPVDGMDCKVIAAEAGEVMFAGWGANGEGFMIEIKHANDYVSRYMHGSGEFYVEKGNMVNAGDPIMMIGCTGFCTGKHLHFSLLKNGVEIDPIRSELVL